MDILAPISKIMTSELITVTSEDKLEEVKKIFDTHRIHHIPVVRYDEIVGLVSKTDFLFFQKGLAKNEYDKELNKMRLHNYTVTDIMTDKIAKLESKDKILTALKVFEENLFHAIPIVDDNKLVGIVTTYDIIKGLLKRE